MSKKQLRNTLALLLTCVIITLFSLYAGRGSEFAGADGKAEEVITELNPDYEPWFSSIIELPGGETESLLFALQAAAGAGFIGYYIGYKRASARNRKIEVN